MTLHVQVITMLTMIAGGIYLGFAQETYRKMAKIWHKKRMLTYISELSFWISQTIILFSMLYRVNYGEVRIYIILACFLGFSMYVVFFQAMYLKILDWFIRLLRSIIYLVYRIISAPLILVYRLIRNIVLWLFNVIKRIVLLLFSIAKFLVKKVVPQKVLNFISKMVMFCSTMVVKLHHLLKKLFSFKRG